MRKLFIAVFMFVSSFGSNVMADGHSIKMGIILGFTGPIESLTPAMAASAELAFKEASDSGSLSGTSLLVLSYKEEEKFKAQGFNDLIVYTVQAIASLSAGIFISLTSWKTMNLVCIIFLIIIIVSTFRADLKQRSPL